MSQNCPFCAEPIEAGLEKCDKCGESLLKGAPCKHHPSSVVTGMCPDCHTYVCAECRPISTQICMHCGDEEVDASKHYELGEVMGLVFKDPDWVNHVLIGTGCFLGSFLFFPLFAFFGYRLRIIRQQWKKPNRTTLPTWDDFGELIVDGLKWWVCILMPAMIIMLTIGVVIGASIAVGASAGKGSAGQTVGIVGAILGYALLLIGMLGMAYVTPAIEEVYLRTGSVTSGLQFKRWWANISSDHVDYLIFFLYHYLITQILGAVGMIVCFVGIYVSIPWAYYTEGAMFGRRLAKKDQQAKQGKRDFDAEFDSEEARA